MSNDNNELKNNAPCEEKQEARRLSEEELGKINGGCTGLTTVAIPGGKISREAAGSVDWAIRQR